MAVAREVVVDSCLDTENCPCVGYICYDKQRHSAHGGCFLPQYNVYRVVPVLQALSSFWIKNKKRGAGFKLSYWQIVVEFEEVELSRRFIYFTFIFMHGKKIIYKLGAES